MALIIKEILDSSLVLTDAEIHESILRSLVDDGWTLEDLSLTSGDVWEAWAFNGKTFEPSVYSGFNFNSYASDNGYVYAAREEGVYVLDGVDDAGEDIHTGVILSPSMFGTNNQKRFRAGFFDIEGATPTVRAEVGGLGSSIPILHNKAVFPRTLVGSRWTFLIADFDELGQVELFPTVLTR